MHSISKDVFSVIIGYLSINDALNCLLVCRKFSIWGPEIRQRLMKTKVFNLQTKNGKLVVCKVCKTLVNRTNIHAYNIKTGTHIKCLKKPCSERKRVCNICDAPSPMRRRSYHRKHGCPLSMSRCSKCKVEGYSIYIDSIHRIKYCPYFNRPPRPTPPKLRPSVSDSDIAMTGATGILFGLSIVKCFYRSSVDIYDIAGIGIIGCCFAFCFAYSLQVTFQKLN